MENNRIHPQRYGSRVRASFAKEKEVLNMPNLIEVQKDSYRSFLEEGLKEVFEDISPITDFSGNLSLEFIGFDLKEVYSFSLADDCVLLMPADLANPVENAACKDLQAWYDAACKKLFDNFYFYAYYKLNDKDELTRLEYVYLP